MKPLTYRSRRAVLTTRRCRRATWAFTTSPTPVVDAVLAPSSELALHLAVCRTTEHTAVVHTHGPASTALSTVVDAIPASHYCAALFGGAVRVAPYATFGTQRLADNGLQRFVIDWRR